MRGEAIKGSTLIQRKPRAVASWNTCFAPLSEEDITANPKFASNTSFGALVVGPAFGGREWENKNVDTFKAFV